MRNSTSRSCRRVWRAVRRVSEPLEARRLLAAIASDQTVNGTLVALGQIDDYTIDAVAGETLVVQIADTGATAFNPRITLLAPGGAQVATATGNTSSRIIANTLAVAGTYTVRVIDDGNNATGSYAMTAVRTTGTSAPNDGDGGAIASGQRKLGTVSLGDVDKFTFAATAGDSVELVIGTASLDAFYAPEVVLYTPAGVQLALNSGAVGSNIVQLALPTTGTYSVLVFDSTFNATTANDYALAIAKAPGAISVDATDSDGGAITSGERRLGSIALGDIDVYSITAGAGETMQIALGDVGATAFVPEMALYSPTGVRLNFNSNNVGGIITALNLPASGSYTIVVRDSSSLQTGNYALSVAKLPSPVTSDPNDPDGGALVSGKRIRGTIELGDIDVFTFTASAGQSVLVNIADLAGNSFTPQVAVYSPTGTRLGFVSDINGTNLYLQGLAVSGTYYVTLVDQTSVNPGTYALSFARSGTAVGADPGDPDGGLIKNGERKLGQLLQGDNDIYSFSAGIGQSAILTVGDVDDSALTPEIIVFTPVGAQINFVTGADGTRLELNNLTASGTYLVFVLDSGGPNTGRYALSLALLSTAINADTTDSEGGAIASGDIRSGALPVGDSDVYSFAGTSGVPVTIRVQDMNLDSFAPRINAYTPTGAAVSSTTNAALAVLTFTPATTGTFYFVVADATGANTGTYSLALNAVPPTADIVAPVVRNGIFDWTSAPHEVRFGLSEAVPTSVDFDDLVLHNNTTGQDVDPASMAAVYDANNYEAVFSFPALDFGLLPDGNYTATLPAGKVTDPAGNPAPSFSFNFFVLAGDVNHDRSVNFDDLVIVAQNYNKLGRTFAEGNLDYSPNGDVAFNDLVILAQNYNHTLPAALMAPTAPAFKHRPSRVSEIL